MKNTIVILERVAGCHTVNSDDFMISVTDAVSRLRAMEWQLIETAPADEKIMLATTEYVSFGRWQTQSFHKKPNPYWQTDRETIYGILWQRANQPAHWMPLPTLPAY